MTDLLQTAERALWARAAPYAAIALIVGAAGGVGGFYLWARHQGAAAERPKTEAARDAGAAASLAAQGERANAVRVDSYVHVLGQAQAATTTLATQAGAAPDAATPVPDDRARRLRAHDDELCNIRPGLCGGPASAGDTGGGDAAVRPVPPAGPADPG